MAWLVIFFLCVCLNGAFVLAEYSIVKTAYADTQTTDYCPALKRIHNNLEEYLLVCTVARILTLFAAGVQAGIFTIMIAPVLCASLSPWLGTATLAVVLFTAALLLVLVGHELPKRTAIRNSDNCATLMASFITTSRVALWPLLWIFNLPNVRH